MRETQVFEMGGLCSKETPEASQERNTNVSLNEVHPTRSVLTYTVLGAEREHCSWKKMPQGDGTCILYMRAVDGSTAYTHSFRVPQDVANELRGPNLTKEGSRLMVTLEHPQHISLRRHLDSSY